MLGIHPELQDVSLRRRDQGTRYVWDSEQNVPILAWEFYSYAVGEKEAVIRFIKNMKRLLY